MSAGTVDRAVNLLRDYHFIETILVSDKGKETRLKYRIMKKKIYNCFVSGVESVERLDKRKRTKEEETN